MAAGAKWTANRIERFIRESLFVLFLYREPFILRMKRSHIGRFQYLSALLVSGAAALAIATWACFLLGLSFATVVCVYMVILVLLSTLDSFVSSVIFSIIAAGCVDFFFQAPIFDLRVQNPQDLTALFAFLITSLVITTLVRQLRRLGQAQRNQARLLDLTRDSVLVRDLEDVITYWNRGGEELYGWKKEEAVGKVTHHLLQTIFPAPRERITEDLLRSGGWEGELHRTRRDGMQVTVASRWSVQLNEDGQPIGILETDNDITERKRAEEALRQIQQAHLAEAQQLSRTGSFGWKVSSGEIFCSEEGARIMGLDSKARVPIELLLDRVHPDDLALVQRVIDRAANDRQDFEFEHRLRLPDGAVKHVRVAARAMRGETFDVDFVGAVMDVTSIRVAELELQNTRAELAHLVREASLRELSASIAHEVNQPLGAIVANAQASLAWLDREFPDLSEVRTAIESIVGDGHRAGEIIRRVRALIKKTDTLIEPLDLNEIVNEALKLAELELRFYRVSQRMELLSDLPLALGDRIQLQQVLINLIINSIEALRPIMDRQRELVIRSEEDDARQVRVTVMDCGIGLSAEGAHKIFDAFVTTKASGMGMGLSICRSIIRAHGGQIWASPNQPHGTAIQFTLPVHRPSAP